MTEVEEKALKAYPDDMGTLDNVKYILRTGFIKGYQQAVKDAIEWLEIALQAGVHPCSGGRLVMEFKQFMEGKE